jgi:hypothetical protein
MIPAISWTDIGPVPWILAVVMGVLILSVLLLLLRELWRALCDQFRPQCCICGRFAGGWHNAITERWRQVQPIRVEYCRAGFESFPGRVLTPPWICGGCWDDGNRPEHIHLPPELLP